MPAISAAFLRGGHRRPLGSGDARVGDGHGHVSSPSGLGERLLVGCVGWDFGERDEGDADVAELLQQSVQCCLVDDRAADDGGAVRGCFDVESVEPGRPAGREAALDPDLVVLDRVVVGSRRTGCGVGVRLVCGHVRTVRTDRVSVPHIMW